MTSLPSSADLPGQPGLIMPGSETNPDSAGCGGKQQAPPQQEVPVIDLASDEFFMGQALRQAAIAYERDEVPVGAVITRNNQIIARAYNQVELLHDATAHAEMLAITQAEAAIGDWRLNDCVLYVTKEPCPMCAGAIVHARLARVVFGASDPKAGGCGGLLNIVQHPSLNHRCQVTSGILAEASRRLLRAFFVEKRSSQKTRRDVDFVSKENDEWEC